MLKRILVNFIIVLSLISSSCSSFNKGYNDTMLKAHEEMLRQDLIAMRTFINDYASEKGALPQSLDDLVKAGYLKEIPDDPITEKKDWKVVIGEKPSLKNAKGIIDVRSSSTSKSTERTPYNEW
jgi:general secretion pathway protein G